MQSFKTEWGNFCPSYFVLQQIWLEADSLHKFTCAVDPPKCPQHRRARFVLGDTGVVLVFVFATLHIQIVTLPLVALFRCPYSPSILIEIFCFIQFLLLQAIPIFVGRTEQSL